MLYVGTAGWAIPRAVADRFPAGGTGLVRYAARLNAAEINSSFYRSHKPETWRRWAESVPPGFRFAVKMPRTISHERQLRGATRLLRDFVREVEGLGDTLGPLLLQLPPKLEFNGRAAATFFAALRSLHGGPVVCEPRHASWAAPSADKLLRRYEIARVAADPPRASATCDPGGWPGIIYYRLHGSPHPYFSAYSRGWLEALAATIDAARPRPAWCIFDNTGSGAAAANALDLRAITG